MNQVPFYHVWFATKRRKWLLQGDVLAAARKEIQLAASRSGFRLLEHEAIVDHVHLLLELDKVSEVPSAMKAIKGPSARGIFKRFPELKLDAGVTSFWQKRYGCKEVPGEAVENVRGYIRSQWQRLESFER